MITLKAARVNTGMTQKEAAKAIGISAQTLLNYEKGRTFPDIRVLPKIEEAYGLSYREIIFLPNEPIKSV